MALFLSFDGELDTQPLIDQLWRAGKRVYLPVLHPFSPGNLLFLHYHPQSQLIVNRLKIREPKLDVRDVLPLAELDVLVTPLVAFDVSGQRLGMGGGFYDRTLQNWQQYRLQPVGYAHDCQQVDSLPSEEWDIPLPAVITPGKTPVLVGTRGREIQPSESINKKRAGTRPAREAKMIRTADGRG